MFSPSNLLVFLLPAVAIATSVFKYPQERNLMEPLVPQCPDDYDEVKPWYEDPNDCNCYYVCDMYGGMVRMCCPAGLWFDANTMNCHYVFSFTKQKQAHCWGNLRGEGSTKQLKEIFMGRCWDFQMYKNPGVFTKSSRDCTALFEKFLEVFFKKPACGEIAMEDYDDFLEMAQHEIPQDMSMFWSGTFDVATDYCNSGKRMFTLESSLSGYLLNELQWCGSTEDPGIDLERCPPFASCDGEAMAAFWARASEIYASQASGIATVMLNGSIPGRPAFRNSSFFAQHELVNFNIPKLHTLSIWVIHNLDRPATETCNFGSVQLLQEFAASMGLNVVCEDNPPEIHALLCVDKPHFPECAQYGFQQASSEAVAQPRQDFNSVQDFIEVNQVDPDFSKQAAVVPEFAQENQVPQRNTDNEAYVISQESVVHVEEGISGPGLQQEPDADSSVFEPEQ